MRQHHDDDDDDDVVSKIIFYYLVKKQKEWRIEVLNVSSCCNDFCAVVGVGLNTSRYDDENAGGPGKPAITVIFNLLKS